MRRSDKSNKAGLMHEAPAAPFWVKLLFGGLLILLISGGVWLFKAQHARQRQEVEARLLSIARLKASQIADWRRERLADASVLTGRYALIQSVERYFSALTDQEASEILRRLRPVQQRYDYKDILLVDPEGRVRLSVAGVSSLHPGFRTVQDSAFAAGHPVWIDLHMEPDHGSPHLSLVAPLHTIDPDHKRLASLVLISDASQYLYPLIQSWPTPSKTAETLLIRREGDRVLFLNELRHQKDTALNLRIPVSRTDLPAAMAVEGKAGIVEGRDYRGVDVVAAVLPVPDSPWYMVSKMDSEEAFADWRFRSYLIVVFILGLSGCVIVAALVTRQRILKTHYRRLYQTEAALRQTLEKHAVTLNAIGDAVISTDARGRVEFINPVAESLTGWTSEEARGRPLRDVFHIVNEETRDPVEDPVVRVLREGVVVGLANHTLLIAKDGRETPIADSGAPIRDRSGTITGVVLVFRDQTEERLTRHLTETRLALIDYAAGHSLDELLTEALDRVGAFVNSPAGFYHFVDPDQKTLTLQQWSTRTLKEFCRAEGKGMHYSIDRAGVWTDCVHEKKPVIHNDYASLPHKKGLPEGHAPVVRELTVPVVREGKVVAILGVGNKPRDYTEKDVEVVSHLADVTWEIIRQKQIEADLAQSEKRLIAAQRIAKMGDFTWNVETGEVTWSDAMFDLLGYDPSEKIDYARVNEEIHHPDDLDRVTEWLNKCIESGENELTPNEYRLVRKNGEVIHVQTQGVIERRNGKSATVFATILDVTELRTREREYKELIDGMNDTAFVIDFNGKFVGVNERAVQTLGYSRDELLSMGPADIDPNLSADQIGELIAGMKSDEKQVFETQHRTKTGGIIPVEISSSPITYQGKKVILSVARDISIRKRAEEDLRRVTEGAHAILWRAKVARLEDASQACKGFAWDVHYLNLDEINKLIPLQGSPDQILQERYEQSIVQEDRALMERNSSDALKQGADRYDQEFRLRDAAGAIHWMREEARIRRMAPNRYEIIGVILDVTEQKQAEEALRASEELYRTIIACTPVALFGIDMDGRVTIWNPSAENMFGWTAEEVIGKPLPIVQADKQDEFERLRKSVMSGEGFSGLEVTRRKKDGSLFEASLSAAPIRDAQGRIIGVMAAMEDITERKRGEKLLKESEARFRKFFEENHAVMLVIDPENGAITDANPAAVAYYGWDRAALLKTSISQINTLSPKEIRKQMNLARSGKRRYFQFRHHRADGSVREVAVYSGPIRMKDKEMLLSLIFDITERVEARRKLAESQRQLSTLMRNLPGMAYRCKNDPAWTMEFVSEGCLDLTGYPSDALIGNARISYADLIHPEDREDIWRQVQKALEQHEPYELTYRIFTSKGMLKWVWERGQGIFGENGEVERLEGFISDITEQRRAQEDLHRVMEGAQAILWHSPVVKRKGKTKGGEEFGWRTRYLNLDAVKERIPLQDHPSHDLDQMYYFSIPEEDRQAMDRISSDALKRGLDRYDQEFRLRDANGVIHWMYEEAHIKKIDETRFEAVGVILDITERKRAHDALRKSEKILNETGKMGKIGGWEHDLKTGKAFWTQPLYDIIEISHDQEPPGVNEHLDYYPEHDRQILEQAYDNAVKTGEPFDLELRVHTSKKKLIWCRVKGEPVPADGQCIVMRGTFQDITDLKRAEEEIRKNLKEKEILLRELYHRTKNNMQVISSMLRLRARSVQNENMRFTFREIENKIHAMSLVHQKLYESRDLSTLNLKNYFMDLIALVRESYLTGEDRIRIRYEATDAPVLIDTAIPLGLALNELLSNAVKHAFPKGREGEISVVLNAHPQKGIVIEVRDNGVGLPAGFDAEKDANLGLETVFDLIQYQLEGEITFENKNGLVCRIALKKELYHPRV